MATRTPVSIAIDAGTTGVRALVVDEQARVVDLAYRELTQHFPRPGRVEHDAAEIWRLVCETLDEVAGRLGDGGRVARAIGITNQRETVVVWDRATGTPLHRALVWQDRRTADRCAALEGAGHLPLVREQTGLVLDPYFSATKMQWLLEEGGVTVGPDLALATVDSWILWNLSGGPSGGVFATDVTNASRTMLFDIVVRRWSDELCDLFDVPPAALPVVRPSCGRFARWRRTLLGAGRRWPGVPISALIGDQHAALFGQACFDRGMTKATFGTGSFVLMNVGDTCPAPVDGLVTTLAWDLGTDGDVAIGADGGPRDGRSSLAYALEGSVFVAGAGVQWLRDGLGIIAESAELEPLARSVDSSDGRRPGAGLHRTRQPPLGSGRPRDDHRAQPGHRSGPSRPGHDRGHGLPGPGRPRDHGGLGHGTPLVRVDGGAAVMGLLLQHLADQARLEVVRPQSVETTALGAATMAGLAEGVWGSLDDLADLWSAEAAFTPEADPVVADLAHASWTRSVDRSRGWAGPARRGLTASGQLVPAVVGQLGHDGDPLALAVSGTPAWTDRPPGRGRPAPVRRRPPRARVGAVASGHVGADRRRRRGDRPQRHGPQLVVLGSLAVLARDPGRVGVHDGHEVGDQAPMHPGGECSSRPFERVLDEQLGGHVEELGVTVGQRHRPPVAPTRWTTPSTSRISSRSSR